MDRMVSAVGVLAAVAVLTAPAVSSATFGKRSDHDSNNSSGSSGNSSGGSSGGSSSGGSSQPSYHPAVPATPGNAGGSYNPPPTTAPAPRPHHPRPDPYYYPYYPPPVWPYTYGWGAYYGPYWGYPGYYYPRPAAPDSEPAQVTEQAPPPVSSLAFGAQVHGEGTTLGIDLAIEGQRWGFNGNFAAAFLKDGETLAVDSLKMVDAHLTFALLTGQRGRLRLEGGVGGVVAPDLAVLGPDAGVSGSLFLVGPLAAEASAHMTPWPHLKLDATVNAAVGLGPVGIKGGWKVVHLDDRGLLGDGSRNTDTFSGPFVSVGLAF
jgi:hypothetical protein